jgi:hypothetical protein
MPARRGGAQPLRNEDKREKNSMIGDGMGTFSTIRNLIGCGSCGKPKSVGMLLGLTLVLASCGGGSSSGGNPTPAPTVTISASPMSIVTGTGTSSTLTVAASNASQVVLTDNIGDLPYTFPAATGGTDVVTPAATATYTATATGANGQTATNTVTVTVTAAPPPPPPNPMVTLSVTPNATLAGAPITLSWNSSNASSVVILDSSGGGPGGVMPNVAGSVTLQSTTSTIYTATAYPETGNTNQATATATVTVNSINSFQGMDASQAEGGTTEDDIDPNGAVGTKQFMEYVNTSYQGYDKTTFAPVWSSPQPIGTPWNALPNQNCAASSIQLDAVIIFDRLVSRWVIAGKSTRGSENKGDYYFCIAVSNTDDLTSPTFAWYPYLFDLVPILGSNATGPYYPDWPKIGTWPTSADGASSYVITMDMEDETSQDELGVAVCGLNRNQLLTGNNGNAELTVPGTLQCFVDTSSLLSGTPPIYIGHSLMPPDMDGNGTSTMPPPAGRDAYLVSIQNPIDPFSTDGPTTSSTINLWDLHLDWTTPTNSTFALISSPPVTTYWPGCYTSPQPAETICIPELGQSSLGGGLQVDSVGDRFMPRFSYRNFGGYESFLISHTVQIGPGLDNCGQSCQLAQQTGIRWYELRGTGSGTPTVAQQGTVAYSDEFFRFLPSISQDKNGNAAVGYSISNPLNNPGISLSYWNLNPIGANQPAEVTILNGTGEEIPFVPGTTKVINAGQWGSYAAISVDPVDDCTFWYVNEYWPTTNLSGVPATWSTNISNFQIPGCQ